jgi:hypothetical protein
MVGENTIKLKSSNIVKFDGMPPKKEQIMQILLKAFKESDNFEKFLVDNFDENKKMVNLLILMKINWKSVLPI